MPWWALIYLLLFLGITFIADSLSVQEGIQWNHVCDAIAGLIFSLLFISYWLPPVSTALGLAAPLLFIAALGWEIYSCPRDLKEIWRDPDLSMTERTLLTTLPPLFILPFYVFAGIAAFDSLT